MRAIPRERRERAGTAVRSEDTLVVSERKCRPSVSERSVPRRAQRDAPFTRREAPRPARAKRSGRQAAQRCAPIRASEARRATPRAGLQARERRSTVGSASAHVRFENQWPSSVSERSLPRRAQRDAPFTRREAPRPARAKRSGRQAAQRCAPIRASEARRATPRAGLQARERRSTVGSPSARTCVSRTSGFRA
jgi:hypothetical protein